MSVHDVARGRWAGVLEQFSRAHRGWLTRVIRVGPGAEQVSATGWHPLESVTSIQAGMHVTAFSVNLQGGPTVWVRAPRTLGVDRREDDAEHGLEIDAGVGEFVRIHFRAAARPEELDSIAPAELGETGAPVAVTPRRRGPARAKG
jgi:hypothetical protein